jgi:hypothetical protein
MTLQTLFLGGVTVDLSERLHQETGLAEYVIKFGPENPCQKSTDFAIEIFRDFQNMDHKFFIEVDMTDADITKHMKFILSYMNLLGSMERRFCQGVTIRIPRVKSTIKRLFIVNGVTKAINILIDNVNIIEESN